MNYPYDNIVSFFNRGLLIRTVNKNFGEVEEDLVSVKEILDKQQELLAHTSVVYPPIVVTQEQYDAIVDKESLRLYIVIDEGGD